MIPNREVKLIYEQQILRWFEKVIKSDSKRLRVFTKAVEMGDAETMAMPPERQQNQA